MYRCEQPAYTCDVMYIHFEQLSRSGTRHGWSLCTVELTFKCGDLWDLKKVSRLERCPDFRGEIIHVCIASGPNEVSSIQEVS